MNAKKGFTLIEIMIVVAIIAILAAVAIPNFIAYKNTASKNACISTQNTIATAVEAYLIAKPSANTATAEAPATISMEQGTLWNANGTGFLKVTTEPKCGGKSYDVKVDNKSIVTVTCQNDGVPEGYEHTKD